MGCVWQVEQVFSIWPDNFSWQNGKKHREWTLINFFLKGVGRCKLLVQCKWGLMLNQLCDCVGDVDIKNTYSR